MPQATLETKHGWEKYILKAIATFLFHSAVVRIALLTKIFFNAYQTKNFPPPGTHDFEIALDYLIMPISMLQLEKNIHNQTCTIAGSSRTASDKRTGMKIYATVYVAYAKIIFCA